MKENNEYNFEEQREKFKDFHIKNNPTSDELYEYCKFLYHVEKKDNQKFKNKLILYLPVAIVQIYCASGMGNVLPRITLTGLGIFLLFLSAYNIGKCEEWNKRNEKFLSKIKELRQKEKINSLYPKDN